MMTPRMNPTARSTHRLTPRLLQVETFFRQKWEDAMRVNKLPHVGRMQGVQFDNRPTPKASRISVQYTDLDGAWQELNMPFLDAMYLLNALKAIALDIGFDVPGDPRES